MSDSLMMEQFQDPFIIKHRLMLPFSFSVNDVHQLTRLARQGRSLTATLIVCIYKENITNVIYKNLI